MRICIFTWVCAQALPPLAAVPECSLGGKHRTNLAPRPRCLVGPQVHEVTQAGRAGAPRLQAVVWKGVTETRRVVSLWIGGSTWGPRRWWSRTGSAGPASFVGQGVIMIPGLAAARMKPSEWRGREMPILPMAAPILFSDSIFLLPPPTLCLEHSSQPRLPKPLRVLAA